MRGEEEMGDGVGKMRVFKLSVCSKVEFLLLTALKCKGEICLKGAQEDLE